MDKMIFISMYLPAEKYPEAGQRLAYDRLKKFSLIYDVHLISFANSREKEWMDKEDYSFCKSLHIVSLSNFRRLINFLHAWPLPFPVAIRHDDRLKKILLSLLHESFVSRIHIEYEQGAVYCDMVDAQCKKTIVLHDVLSQSLERMKNNSRSWVNFCFYKETLKKLYIWERERFCRFDEIVVLNNKDKEIISKIVPYDVKVSISYPEVNADFYKVDRSKYIKGRIIFWGAMNRKENIDAVDWFLSDIFPLIREKIPESEFCIVGANPPSRLKNENYENVIVTGFVDSPVEYFESAQVMVAPLRYGAGIKLKVLEGLAAGMKIVGTTVAAEGVEDSEGNLIVCDDPVAIANNLIEIILSK